jgi:hypothetical protein
MLTEGAEELHMLVLDLKARVQALEQKAVDAVENYVDGHDALTTVPTNTMVEPDHPLAGDTKTPIDLLGDVVTLIRRHFGADAV